MKLLLNSDWINLKLTREGKVSLPNKRLDTLKENVEKGLLFFSTKAVVETAELNYAPKRLKVGPLKYVKEVEVRGTRTVGFLPFVKKFMPLKEFDRLESITLIGDARD